MPKQATAGSRSCSLRLHGGAAAQPATSPLLQGQLRGRGQWRHPAHVIACCAGLAAVHCEQQLWHLRSTDDSALHCAQGTCGAGRKLLKVPAQHSTAQHSHVVREVLPGSTASKRTTQQAPEPLPELQWHSRGSVAGLLLAPDQQTALMACWKPDLAGSLSTDLCSTLPQRDRPRQANSTIILQPDPDDLAANEGTILPVHCCCCIAPFPDGPHDQALTTPAVTSSKYTRDAGGKVSPLGL
jgi:hypothetical protein